MNCPKCGYDDVPDSARFCPQCEAALLRAPQPAAQIEVAQRVGTVEGGEVVGVDLGQVLGDVTIGNYTLTIGTLNGGVVNLAPPQQQSPPQPRTLPVFLLPRRSPGLLDREEEVNTATTTLQSAAPAEFHGPPGIGKTKLLRHLAHDQLTSAVPDGVVYFSAIHRKPVEDLLLDLFDAFYERELTYKPTPTQMRHALRGGRALVVLDDVDLERDEVAELMDAAPNCTFLLASTECCLWGEGRALALQGLPPDDALALVERELGRHLTEEERTAAEALSAALEGHPLRLLQLAALIRENGYALTDLAARLRPATSPAEALRDQALAACSEQEQRILAALAAPMGASLGDQHVRALTGITDVEPVLDSLQRRQLVQSHSPRYNLTGSLEEALQEEWDLTAWNEQALEHFAAWAEQHQQAPERVAEEADAILGILQWALREGRWEEALRLGRAMEGPLALGGQWGAWTQVLGWELQAARELGDRSAEAWSLHQSGTQALCLEDASSANVYLAQALELRESLGDWEGAAVTQHNLRMTDWLGGGYGPEDDGGVGGDGGRGWGPWLWPGAIIGILSILTLIIAAALGWGLRGSAEIEVSPTNVSFSDQEVGTTSAPQTVSLKNTGEESLEIGDVTLAGEQPDDFSADHICSGLALDPERECTIAVSFTPSDTGSRSAELRITDNAAGSPRIVPLDGVGTKPAEPTQPRSENAPPTKAAAPEPKKKAATPEPKKGPTPPPKKDPAPSSKGPPTPPPGGAPPPPEPPPPEPPSPEPPSPEPPPPEPPPPEPPPPEPPSPEPPPPEPPSPEPPPPEPPPPEPPPPEPPPPEPPPPEPPPPEPPPPEPPPPEPPPPEPPPPEPPSPELPYPPPPEPPPEPPPPEPPVEPPCCE